MKIKPVTKKRLKLDSVEKHKERHLDDLLNAYNGLAKSVIKRKMQESMDAENAQNNPTDEEIGLDAFDKFVNIYMPLL